MTKKSGMELWPCRNSRKKIYFSWFVAMPLPKLRRKKLWEWICGNGIVEIGWKKQLLQLVCDNGIAEIEERYAYSYSFSNFLTEIIWFVTFFNGKSNLRNIPYFKYIDFAHCKQNKKKKYIDSKQIRIDSSTLILILKCTL